MELVQFPPTNELLRKHIECYHISNYDEEYLNQEILIYPHYLHTVSLQNDYLTVISQNQVIAQKQTEPKFNLSIIGRFTKPILCKLAGRIKALTIVFKPTGINFFCNKPFAVIVPN